jgi:hypothetical protein
LVAVTFYGLTALGWVISASAAATSGTAGYLAIWRAFKNINLEREKAGPEPIMVAGIARQRRDHERGSGVQLLQRAATGTPNLADTFIQGKRFDQRSGVSIELNEIRCNKNNTVKFVI